MDFLESLRNRLKSKGVKNIVFPEYKEERFYYAAEKLLKEGLVKDIYFTGDESYIKNKAKELKVNIDGIKIIPIEGSDYYKDFADEYFKLRESKGITKEEAYESMKNELYFGAMLVRKGIVDGMVAGAMNTTADVVRSAIRVIGTKEGVNTVSSFFVMVHPNKEYGDNGILFFADCAVVINPTASQLADIAISTAESMKLLTDLTPRVAFLSFSTKGSASHPNVDKVINAFNTAKEKRPDILMDGELQADAALVERVAKKKLKESPVAGRANVLIFPDLNAGNIGYKLTQYLGNAQAIGPILQGLAKPVNDLSRGCSVDDIVNVACITQLLSYV